MVGDRSISDQFTEMTDSTACVWPFCPTNMKRIVEIAESQPSKKRQVPSSTYQNGKLIWIRSC